MFLLCENISPDTFMSVPLTNKLYYPSSAYNCFKRPSDVTFWHKLTLKCVHGTAPNMPGSTTLSWAAADRGPFNNVNIFIEGEAEMMANSW